MKQVLVIGGPTGSGESTVTNAIIKQYPDKFVRLVTATTRAPRGGEQNKVDYHFLTTQEFLNALERGDILEHTYVPNRDTYYGTYKPDLDEKISRGLTVIVNPDIVGTRYFRKHYGATTLFIEPASVAELEGRLIARNPDLPLEEIRKRLENAQNEIDSEGPEYDYRVTNANGKLDEAIQQVLGILSKEGYL